ncbi:MAG TPA: hypothetical protein VLB27_01695, partial [candidate division Zixibacteria bacterium]|nr:hypothetical protein [candidate division Zixibacteria bacterium]
MRFPAPKLSLTARYALFVFGVIAVLLVASQLITANVVRSGLKDLFTQRLERSATALTQYADVHFIGKVSEIEAIVSSPRFIAAVETMDSATVANEAPYYRQLLESSVFIIEGRNSEFVFGLKGADDPDGFDRFTMIRINEILQEDVSEIHTHYVLNQNELFELFHTSIVTYDGLHIGTALIGERVSSFMIDDLEQL